ncbi:MAG: glycosyltransferase family 2 protein, partial [Bacteroidota bacterium]
KIMKFKKAGGIEVIDNNKNKGKAASLNQALKLCSGELVACIDSDTYPAPDALKKMVEQFYDKRVGASIALVCVSEPKTFVQKVQEIEYFVAFGFWHTCLARLNGLLVTPGPMSVYRKKALEEIGGFDEKNITEDMEIALNLHQHNYKIVCTTEAKIYTEVPATLPKLFKQRLRWSRGKIFNGKKYFHMLFNSKYNDFGKFVYPMSFVVEFLSLVVVARIFFLYAEAVVKAVTSFINISGVETNLLYNLQLYDTVTINSSVFFMATTLILWAYIIWLSFRIAREGVKLAQVPAIIVFMLFYSIFISTTYFASMVHEIIGSEAQW